MSAPQCCRTGPEAAAPTCKHWRSFERQMLLARLRWNLERVAKAALRRMMRKGINPDAGGAELGLGQAMLRARPRSWLIPWNIPDQIVDKVARQVAAEVAGRRAG